jgi:(p)ppGpp synthase/HD superfamily hydrolase
MMGAVRRHLLTMPLHAVTEVHGEEGLRERFALELGRFREPDRERLADALALASELHRDQRRVREPYVNHLLRVTIRIICYYRVYDVDVLVAALLHDAVEDQPGRLGGSPEAALRTLADRYGTRVAELVGAVTNPAYAPDRDEDQQYREHVAATLDRYPWVRVIKISDFTDNGVGVIHTTGPKLHRAASKYAPLVPVLRQLVARPDTPLADDVKAHIAEQLDLADTRFRAILG